MIKRTRKRLESPWVSDHSHRLLDKGCVRMA